MSAVTDVMKSRVWRVVFLAVAMVTIALIWANHRVDSAFRNNPESRVDVERWILAKKGMIVGEGRAEVLKAFGEPDGVFFWLDSVQDNGGCVALKLESGSDGLNDKVRGSILDAVEERAGDHEKVFRILQNLKGFDAGGMRGLLGEIESESLRCYEVWFYRNEMDLGLEFTFRKGRVTGVGERF